MGKALVFGAGNIGRGFIGQLFSQSGYHVVFADINETLIETINRLGSYPISIVSNESSKEIVVEPVSGVNSRDTDAVSKKILETDLIATAVGMGALENIAIALVKGLKKRWGQGNLNPINIIICENMLHADKYMEKTITSHLSREEHTLFKKTVGLVEASIGRMVPHVVQKNKKDNPLRIFVEEYDELPVNKEGFKGEIPNIKNMIPYSPFSYYIHRKLYIHNMGHAITAYLGSIKSYKYIWEAIADPVINEIVTKAFQEAAEAISKEHNVSIKDPMTHAEDLMNRFSNRALRDTTERVARDPIRKLSANDRLGGATILCSRHGILPTTICLGIAAGLLYKSPQDQSASKIQEYINKNGIEAAISHFCSFKPNGKKHRLVLDFYRKLKSGLDLKSILSAIENQHYI